MKFEPQTIRELVVYLCSQLRKEGRDYILANDSSSIHFSAGMSLRNDFGLWNKESPLVQDAIKTYGIAHADDISGLVYDWVWAIIRSEEFNPLLCVERFHKHWKQFGQTSLEAGGII